MSSEVSANAAAELQERARESLSHMMEVRVTEDGSVGWSASSSPGTNVVQNESPWAMVVSSPCGMCSGSQAISRLTLASLRVRESSHWRVQRAIWRAIEARS